MDTKFRSVVCDFCGSNEKNIIGIPEISEIVENNINIPKEIFVVKCKKCGFYYTDPMPFWGPKDIEKLYGAQYFPEYSDWWRDIRENINPNRRLDLIQKYHTGRVANILEVGCGEGLMMRQAVRRGWKVYGQDVSRHNAIMVKQKLGIDIFVGELESAKYQDDFFDAIYLDSVIEHVPEPTKIIEEIYRILKPNGLLYIVCPNEDALANYVKQMIFWLKGKKTSSRLSPFYNPYHIIGFNKKVFKNITKHKLFDAKYIFIGRDFRACNSKKYINESKLNWRGRLEEQLWNIIYSIGDRMGLGTNIEVLYSAIKRGNR